MSTLENRNGLFILTITGNDEHRLNPTRIDSIRSALSLAKSESESTKPTALITTAHGKYFSNGYDLSWALSDPTRPKLMSAKLRLLISELISLPMPTIAAVTGLILALSHDYVLMRKDRGFLYLNELEIGYKIPNWFLSVMRSKAASPRVVRDVVLTARKVTAEIGVDWGFVDVVCGGAEETVEKAERMGREMVRRGWDGRVYGENRRTVLAYVLACLGSDETVGDFGDEDENGTDCCCKAVSRL